MSWHSPPSVGERMGEGGQQDYGGSVMEKEGYSGPEQTLLSRAHKKS
jgi:hypothetical protein